MTEPTSEPGYTVVNMTVRVMIIVVSLVGNCLILAAVRKSQHFSRVTRHLIGHVAIADIVFVCSVMFNTYLILQESRSYQACLGSSMAGMVSGLCSCWSVCLIFLDNYLSVRRKGPAEPGFSLPKARWCIVCGWLVTIIYIVYVVYYLPDAPKSITTICRPGLLFTDKSLLSVGVLILVVTAVTMFFMLLTLYTIKKRSDTLFQEGSHVQNVQRQQNLKMRSRVVRLFTVIAIGFIISWCPISIALCIAALCTNRCGVTEDHFKLVLSFTLLNAVMNIIVYVIKDKKFRQDVKRAITCQANQVAPRNNIVAMVTTPAAAAANSATILNSTLTPTNAPIPHSASTATSVSPVNSATPAPLDTAISSTAKPGCDSIKQK